MKLKQEEHDLNVQREPSQLKFNGKLLEMMNAVFRNEMKINKKLILKKLISIHQFNLLVQTHRLTIKIVRCFAVVTAIATVDE
jgi:hypothetical protein